MSAERRSEEVDADFLAVLYAARSGEEWAFRVLFREWHPPLIRFLRARKGSTAWPCSTYCADAESGVIQAITTRAEKWPRRPGGSQPNSCSGD